MGGAVQHSILDALRGRWVKITEAELIAHVYRDREMPFYPLLAVQAAIRRLNRRLARGGRQIVVMEGKYRLVRKGGGHAGGTNHRNVHRRDARRAVHGDAATRETE